MRKTLTHLAAEAASRLFGAACLAFVFTFLVTGVVPITNLIVHP